MRRGERLPNIIGVSRHPDVLTVAPAKVNVRSAARSSDHHAVRDDPAFRNDHDSIANAEENVQRNGVEGRVTVIEGDAAVLLPLVAPVRVVLANIISSVLLELLPTIEAALTPDGEAVLSGIMLEEREMMLNELDDRGWNVLAQDAEGLWWSARIARR